jgi:hypothetical protein
MKKRIKLISRKKRNLKRLKSLIIKKKKNVISGFGIKVSNLSLLIARIPIYFNKWSFKRLVEYRRNGRNVKLKWNLRKKQVTAKFNFFFYQRYFNRSGFVPFKWSKVYKKYKNCRIIELNKYRLFYLFILRWCKQTSKNYFYLFNNNCVKEFKSLKVRMKRWV